MGDYFSWLDFDQKKELNHEIQVTGTLGECELVTLMFEIAKKGNSTIWQVPYTLEKQISKTLERRSEWLYDLSLLKGLEDLKNKF